MVDETVAECTDEELMAAIAARDEAAFAALYDRYASLVYALARRILRRDSDAQAVVEISVLHESDATSRELGYVPELDSGPLVPMVYMLDATGTSRLLRSAEGP